MSNQTNITPYSWLLRYNPPSPLLETDWPFTKITLEQFAYFRTLRSGAWNEPANLYIVYVLCPFGMLGNLFIILTLLLGKRNEAYTPFDYSMFGVALSDLIFVSIKFPYAYIDTIVTEWTSFQWVAGGVQYSCSMMSDLIILCLTIDRYVSVGFPVAYNANARRRRLAWRIGILVSFLLSATRFHYWIHTGVVCAINSPGTDPIMCSLKYVLNLFADTIAPFVLMFLMLVLIALILRALWRRSRKVGQISNTTQTDKAFAQFRRNFTLLVVMFVMYFLNQFGYMFYCISGTCLDYLEVGFDSTYGEAKVYVLAKLINAISNVTSNLLEVASRALTFYPYVLCSASFRGYFVAMFKRSGVQNGVSVGTHSSQVVNVKPQA